MTNIDTADPAGYHPMSEEVKQNGPERFWEMLRQKGPVHHYVLPARLAERISSNPLAARSTTEFWSVLGHAEALQVLCNPQQYSSAMGPGPEWMASSSMGEATLLSADDPDHLRQRRLAAKAFTPRSVEGLLPRMQSIVDSLIDARAEHGTMEIAEDLSLPLSIRTIAGIMGVPEDQGLDLQRWGNAIVAAFGGDESALQAGFVGLTDLAEYTQTLIDAIRAGEADRICDTLDSGVLAALVRAEHDGTRLTDGEIRMACMQLITAGFETTSTAIANGAYALCTHPDQRDLFESGAVHLPEVIEEILRFASPLEGLFRTTNEDVEVGGCPVAANSKVRVVYAAANRDPEMFSEPETFRVDRPPAELKAHIAFGKGTHACIGASLARAEMRIALGTLFQRLPGLELDPDTAPVRNTDFNINGFRKVAIRWDPTRVVGRQA